MEEWNFDEIILYKNMHEIHGGGHIWIVWTHFNLEHGSLLIIAVLRLDYPADPGHGPAPSVHLPLPLCGAAALFSAAIRHGLGGVLAVLPDDFLIGLQVNVVMRENCAML